MTVPCCRLGTYLSWGVWSGGQRAKEGICGALKVTEFDPAFLGSKNIGVSGVDAEDAAAGGGVEGAVE